MTGFQEWLNVRDPAIVAEHLAEQHRLTREEFEKIRDALAPAFALGLRQAMGSPARWADLSEAFFALTPGAGDRTASGDAFLDTVFNSSALRDAVSRQASTFTGMAPDILAKLMPDLAAIAVETMVRATMDNVRRQQGPAFASGDIGSATAEMMRRGANAVEALTQPSDMAGSRRADPGAAIPPTYFTEAFAGALRGGVNNAAPEASARTRPREATDPASPMVPFAAMFDAFTKGMISAIDDAPASRSAAATASQRSEPPKPEDGLVGGLMETGRRFQEDYAREMAALFDRYADRT